jgi:hypothetical protein
MKILFFSQHHLKSGMKTLICTNMLTKPDAIIKNSFKINMYLITLLEICLEYVPLDENLAKSILILEN